MKDCLENILEDIEDFKQDCENNNGSNFQYTLKYEEKILGAYSLDSLDTIRCEYKYIIGRIPFIRRITYIKPDGGDWTKTWQ